MSDEELVRLFKEEGSGNYAFNMMVRKHQEKVYAVIRRMVIDHDDASDLAQEVWIKAYKSLSNFKEEAKLSTWLYRIAVNETLTFLNKRKRRFFLPIHDVEEELSAKVDGGAYFSGDEIEKKLQKAILSLPAKQRVVFQLRYFDEMPYEQMSEVLGTSIGALKASYHHAAKKIEEFVTKTD